MSAGHRAGRSCRGHDALPQGTALLRSLADQGRPLPARAQFFDLAMQLLPALASSPRIVAREAPAGRHLPYSHHVDDHTIATRDGLLMRSAERRVGKEWVSTGKSRWSRYN